MARVTLAYRHGDHDAGDTIDVDDDDAQQLIRDGIARPAGETSPHAPETTRNAED